MKPPGTGDIRSSLRSCVLPICGNSPLPSSGVKSCFAGVSPVAHGAISDVMVCDSKLCCHGLVSVLLLTPSLPPLSDGKLSATCWFQRVASDVISAATV